MKEKYNQEKFFNSTLSKIENNLTKLIFETNFSNEQSILLREEVKKYKRKLIRKSNSQKNYEPFYTKINQNIFPFINNRINPNALNKNSTIFTSLIKNKNIISHKQDMKHIFVKDSLKKEIKNYNNKKYLKYSNENMNKRFYHTQLHDKSMNAIIRNKDIDKGLLDMINKGLIPKCSDVTPAFNRDGNPFSITSTNFNKISLNDKTQKNSEKLLIRMIYQMLFKINSDTGPNIILKYFIKHISLNLKNSKLIKLE